MNDLTSNLIVAIISAPFGAVIALWFDRRGARRDERARLREYRVVPSGEWQPWREGIYDIRDWAGSTASYLRSRDPSRLDFSMIRIPGSKYLAHMVSTGRVPSDQVQGALVLQGYCEMLEAALSDVFARDLDRHEPAVQTFSRQVAQAIKSDLPMPTTPALVQLADAVEQLARELLDPEAERRKARAEFVRAFGASGA